MRFLEHLSCSKKRAYFSWGVECELKVSMSQSTPLHSSQIIDLPPPKKKDCIIACDTLRSSLRSCCYVFDCVFDCQICSFSIVFISHQYSRLTCRWWTISLIVLLLVIHFDHLCGHVAMCLIVYLIVKYVHFLLYLYLTNIPI